MPYSTTVVNVLIASPSDVAEARDVVEREIGDWNRAHAVARRLTLVPVRWERDALPQLGAPPQQLLNEQFVRTCDIGIGIFGGRLGTPTLSAASGTVEELDLLVRLERQVMVYFLEDLSAKAAPAEAARLGDYREALRAKGIYWPVADLNALAREVRAHLAKAAAAFASQAGSARPYAVLGDRELDLLRLASLDDGTLGVVHASSVLQIQYVTAQYHLEKLVEAGLMESSWSPYDEPFYALTQRGRAELHERGLLR